MEPVVTLSADDLATLRDARRAIAVDDAIFRLDGPSVAECLQGVLTNDVIRPGPHALVWGAVLTPKGMIVSDAWVLRDGARAWMVVPRSARETVRQLFARSFPPRLAKVTDCGDTHAARWLTGGVPPALDGATIATPSGPAPFAALVVTEAPDAIDARLADAGWSAAPSAWRDALALLGGWPTLGREIDEKTLPQEVRFDELDGVKYDKGCYTGQETVARLHFRGHANRLLRGLRWREAPAEGTDVQAGDKTVGTVRTVARLGAAWLGLAVIRREIEPGAIVRAAGREAEVVEPPFAEAKA